MSNLRNKCLMIKGWPWNRFWSRTVETLEQFEWKKSNPWSHLIKQKSLPGCVKKCTWSKHIGGVITLTYPSLSYFQWFALRALTEWSNHTGPHQNNMVNRLSRKEWNSGVTEGGQNKWFRFLRKNNFAHTFKIFS